MKPNTRSGPDSPPARYLHAVHIAGWQVLGLGRAALISTGGGGLRLNRALNRVVSCWPLVVQNHWFCSVFRRNWTTSVLRHDNTRELLIRL